MLPKKMFLAKDAEKCIGSVTRLALLVYHSSHRGAKRGMGYNSGYSSLRRSGVIACRISRTKNFYCIIHKEL